MVEEKAEDSTPVADEPVTSSQTTEDTPAPSSSVPQPAQQPQQPTQQQVTQLSFTAAAQSLPQQVQV